MVWSSSNIDPGFYCSISIDTARMRRLTAIYTIFTHRLSNSICP